ncbi:hypothetical protein lerEdw1_008199 [Lerista edwardsae]|nr:hypothetical protein lerEdw1_008199 [Lerista edwardsae]
MAKLSATITSRAGSWFLLAFFCLSLLSSLVAHPARTKGPPTGEKPTANLSVCLTTSAHLMKAVDDSLHHLQKTFNCTMVQILLNNPNNEEKIQEACVRGKSSKPGSCIAEANDVVDQAWCMGSIYTILKHYEVEIKTFNAPNLLNAVNHMMQALKTDHKITEQPASIPHPLKKRYENDLNQCQILLILQQLSQTINRALNFRKSLEI